MENVCLVAYMAKVPLVKVEKMRSKYSWDIIKQKLGLTPNVYEERCIAYQARRLQERMDMPVELTISLMNEGYGMHHSNTAFLLSKCSDKSIKEILAAKTPGKSWKKVAEELTKLPISLINTHADRDLKAAQNKISAAFGRH